MFKEHGVTVCMDVRFITTFHQLQRLFEVDRRGIIFAFLDLKGYRGSAVIRVPSRHSPGRRVETYEKPPSRQSVWRRSLEKRPSE
jgi:hypothetical protein